MATSPATDLDSLGHLEERISRAVEVVGRLRAENQELQQRLDAANVETKQALEELEELRSERKQVRERIEKLLGQMDVLSGS